MRLLLLVLLLACACATTGSNASKTQLAWPGVVDHIIQGYFARHPEDAVQAGRHEFDGKVPDLSEAGHLEEIEWMKKELRYVENYAIDLTPEEKREREYVIAVLKKRLFWADTMKWWKKSPLAHSDVFDPEAYVAREYAPLEERLKGYIALLEATPAAVAQLKTVLSGAPMPKPYSEVGKLVYGGYADFFAKDGIEVFASVKDKGNLVEASAKASAALKDFSLWLGHKNATEDAPFAIGADAMAQMLAETEHVTVPLSRIEELGRADLERNLAALATACAKVAPGKSLTDCVAQVHAKKPAEGPVAGATRQLVSLKKFVIEKDLVTVPEGEDAKVKETPPYERWNAAAIKIPGPYEKGLPSWYVIAPPDPAWSQKERDEYVMGEADLLAVSVHEVWPGHFLNYLHAKRSSSMIGRLFVGYAFAEGWAHYTEEMMIEAGLADGQPEVHIGQIQEALLRNVRLLSAIGLHTGTMTVEQSVRLFQEKGMQDLANAKQQARRGTFDPAYLNYTMGKWMIRKLRDDWCATRGGRKAWKQFHDEFLSYGGPPVPMVRRWMLGAGEPL